MRLLRNFGIIASSKSGGAIEPGLIVMWYGTAQTVPDGWALCDGTNGNPDLRNPFIVGSEDTYAIGATGGFLDTVLISHSHTTTINSHGHGHSITVGPNTGEFQNGRNDASWDFSQAYSTAVSTSGGSHSHTSISINSGVGVSPTNGNLPPYYGLFYIIKVEEA